MAFEIVDGATGAPHISSEDLACMNESVLGARNCVFPWGSQFAATVESANGLTIASGSGMVGAKRFWNKSNVTLIIENGSQGQKRNDVVVARYSKSSDGRESVEPVVLKGTPTAGNPSDPAIGENDLKLWRIPIDGITVGSPEKLFSAFSLPAALGGTGGVLPVSKGGTGSTTAAAARTALGITPANIGAAASGHTHSKLDAYPVGAVYMSWNSTSPASLFGGSWTAITGRFPYFNAGTGTGGSNTHTLTVGQMPKHNHNMSIWLNNGTGTTGGGGTYGFTYSDYGGYTGGNWDTKWVSETGSGESHNNMPAYQTLYAWRRTA